MCIPDITVSARCYRELFTLPRTELPGIALQFVAVYMRYGIVRL